MEHMNHFLDCLEGLSIAQSQRLPRRKVPPTIRRVRRKRHLREATRGDLNDIPPEMNLDSKDDPTADMETGQLALKESSGEDEEAFFGEIKTNLCIQELELQRDIS